MFGYRRIRPGGRRIRAAAVLAVIFVGGCAIGVTTAQHAKSSGSEPGFQFPVIANPAVPSAAPAPIAAEPQPVACPLPDTRLDCDLQQRISAVDAYLGERPGVVGYVVRDRTTGTSYRNANAGSMIWTASVIKLGMAVDLLTRNRDGEITLTDDDRELMSAMLRASDNDAADALWNGFGGPERKFNDNFPAYGISDARAETTEEPYWGRERCTADDLDRLVQHILTAMHPDDAAYLVNEMRHVDTNQQWGVWAAGGEAGNKNGWSDEDDGYVVNTVGFSGPGERYTLAIMNSLDADGYDDGVETVSHIAEMLLAGRG